MIIAGYRMKDDGYGITVSEYEANWSFFLQGDDATQFRTEWEAADLAGINFKSFLYNHEYTQLFQQFNWCRALDRGPASYSTKERDHENKT